MSQYGSAVEYALHCLLFLTAAETGAATGTRDIAEFQKLSTDYVAKLFTRLEKAGLVASRAGLRGGFNLARPAAEITVLDVIDAVEGAKPLFACREVRANCILFDAGKPVWAGRGVCGIHAVMLRAERAMRASLAQTSLAQLSSHVADVVPKAHQMAARHWFQDRAANRGRDKNLKGSA